MGRLKELREDRDLKQSEVGKRLGLTNTAISNYENEYRQLSPELICKFCDFYHVTADYLLGRSSNPHPVISDMDAAIIKAYNSAPLKIQKVVMELLEIDENAEAKKDASAS